MMAAAPIQQNGTHTGLPIDLDPPDSRKRPLEAPPEAGNTKRTNTGEDGQYFLKVLIPSYAAGSIIGKGGQTIVQLQKETGATIKLSKSKDFYPGTTERVCLIQGTVEALNAVHSFIAEKIREMPQNVAKTEPVSILQPQTTVNPDRIKQTLPSSPTTTKSTPSDPMTTTRANQIIGCIGAQEMEIHRCTGGGCLVEVIAERKQFLVLNLKKGLTACKSALLDVCFLE